MRFRSTGLGNTEMRGYASDLVKKGGFLVLYVKTTQPAGWTIRAGMTYGDLFKVICLALKPKTLLSILFGWLKGSSTPEDF